MQITITTDSNPEGWGDDCNEQTAELAAERLAQALADYAAEQWPEAEITTATEHVVSGGSSQLVRMPGETDGDRYNEVCSGVAQVAEDLAERVLGEVLDDAVEPSAWHRAQARANKLFGDDPQAIEFCLADWPEGEDHWNWLADSPEQEIRDWVAAGVA